MPRLEIKYEDTIMYKIVCNDLNIKDLYVGQTTNFTVRKGAHKRTCRNEKGKCYNLKVYQFIRANGGWDNFSMVEIEKYSCEDSKEAHARERFWIESLNATLNSYIPARTWTQAEYYQLHRESKLAHSKMYNLANIEYFHRKINCECGGNYVFVEQKRHFRSQKHLLHIENPELTILNALRTPLEIEVQRKESKSSYNKIHHLASRERRFEKFNCECGGCYIFSCKERHFKTQKHLAHLENIEPLPLAI